MEMIGIMSKVVCKESLSYRLHHIRWPKRRVRQKTP